MSINFSLQKNLAENIKQISVIINKIIRRKQNPFTQLHKYVKNIHKFSYPKVLKFHHFDKREAYIKPCVKDSKIFYQKSILNLDTTFNFSLETKFKLEKEKKN